MATSGLPSQSTLDKLLRYEEETGRLFWRERPPEYFGAASVPAELAARRWNSRMAGKEALATVNCHGYRHGTLFGRTVSAHRVIWKLAYGEDAPIIDHISGDQGDNRLLNLRSGTHGDNMRNRKAPIRVGNLPQGVRRVRNRYTARIVFNGEEIFLGSFQNVEEAHFARKKAEREYGFHENHGRK